jgi:hypothetical protein
MAKFSKIILLKIFVFMLLLLTNTSPSIAQSQQIIDSIRRVRAEEAGGDYKDAGEGYYSILENQCIEGHDPSISRGFEAALGRRAVACLTIAARGEMEHQDPSGGWEHSEALAMLVNTWRVMLKIEPNNPVWYYLPATRECSQGRYVEARNHLLRALRTNGGQPSVRVKAKALLSHINRYADNDQAKIVAEDSAALKCLLSGQMARAWGAPVSSSSSSSSSSSGSGISDSERRARDAESAGDSAAASRFRSGGTTVKDSSNYW